MKLVYLQSTKRRNDCYYFPLLFKRIFFLWIVLSFFSTTVDDNNKRNIRCSYHFNNNSHREHYFGNIVSGLKFDYEETEVFKNEKKL